MLAKTTKTGGFFLTLLKYNIINQSTLILSVQLDEFSYLCTRPTQIKIWNISRTPEISFMELPGQ